MAGLLYKELILNKKSLFSALIGILFISIYALIPARDVLEGPIYTFSMLSICLVIYMLSGAAQQGVFMSDENKRWTYFVTSTPQGVKGQILSKYYFSLLIGIATLVYCTLIFSINAVIQGEDCGVLSLAIAMNVAQLILRSAEFPFLVRFGSKYGNNMRIALAFALVFIVIVYMLFGDMSIFGTFEGFMEWFTSLLEGKAFGDGILTVISLVPIFAALMYYFSYKLSCKLYPKGVENYDK